jgi:CheY-like chemotaxis protein
VLDIGMPGLNGYQVAHQIRTRLWSEPIVPLALSGWGQPQDLERVKGRGI